MVPLRRIVVTNYDHDRFEKGMAGEFGWKSFELGPNDTALISQLQSVEMQNARLRINSQGYSATEFGIGGQAEWLKSAWNTIASKVNSFFDREIGINEMGMPIVKQGRLLPRFVMIGPSLRQFIRRLNASERLGGGA